MSALNPIANEEPVADPKKKEEEEQEEADALLRQWLDPSPAPEEEEAGSAEEASEALLREVVVDEAPADPKPRRAAIVPPSEEEEEDSELTSLARWMELEIAGPVRFNANLARELHAQLRAVLDGQRRTEFLTVENNLLRTRQQERQSLLAEITEQQHVAWGRSIETVLAQQHQIVAQQHALLRALKVYTVAFEVGAKKRPYAPPEAFAPPRL